jgi:membrane protease YdiL (CAAX protease family)
MNLADYTLITLIASTCLSSGYFLFSFYKKHPSIHTLAQPESAPTLNLPWSFFLLYLIGFLFCLREQKAFLIPYAVCGVFILLLQQKQLFSLFWNIRPSHILDYIRSATKSYLTLFLPFCFLTAANAWVFTSLNYPQVHQPAVEILMSSADWRTTLYFLSLACILAPLWEEITFRGFLYPFLKSKLGLPAAVILSALLFAALHVHLPSFVPLTFLGIILALLYERKGSLAYCIMLHSIFNLCTCTVLLFLKHSSRPDLWRTF